MISRLSVSSQGGDQATAFREYHRRVELGRWGISVEILNFRKGGKKRAPMLYDASRIGLRVSNDKQQFVRSLKMESANIPLTPVQELSDHDLEGASDLENADLFGELKMRFLTFKKQQYLKNLGHFENLAEAQYPKFMVIACADSRVCPSAVLGLQPGEAFTIRNVANLVPPYEGGPSETNAALEFAVNTLEVGNIFVIGHSRCGGIRALMSMQKNEADSSFIQNWVVRGKGARLRTLSAASSLCFDHQCKYCEKESINQSLQRLLTYPWIEEKVRKNRLRLHGGYYDFTDCSFEKWTLHYMENKEHRVKDREFWS